MDRADELIRRLGLQSHPEGGHFAETFRSPVAVPAHGGIRAAVTVIHFLLRAGEVSRWHRVLSDEAWHWYEGGELELAVCERSGAPVSRHRLGPVADGVQAHAVVPAGWWQAARPLGAYALVGCTVAPGFDFRDFTLIDPGGPLAIWLRPRADGRFVDGA